MSASFGGSLLSQEHTPVIQHGPALSRSDAGAWLFQISSKEKGRRLLVRQETSPALNLYALRRVERLPLGADWPAPEAHAGLLRGAVGLSGIAGDAGGNAVRPARRTPLRAGHDVVDRDLRGAGLRS